MLLITVDSNLFFGSRALATQIQNESRERAVLETVVEVFGTLSLPKRATALVVEVRVQSSRRDISIFFTVVLRRRTEIVEDFMVVRNHRARERGLKLSYRF